MLLKLIRSSKIRIGWDNSSVQCLNHGMTNISVHPVTGSMEVHPDVKLMHLRLIQNELYLGAKPAKIWASNHVVMQKKWLL